MSSFLNLLNNKDTSKNDIAINAGFGLSLFVLAFGADHVEIIGHLRQYFTIRWSRFKG
jgi:hypothetical protein